VLGAAAHDPYSLQAHPNGLVLHPDTGLLGHVVGQAPQRPQRERQPEAAGPPANRPEQPFLALLGRLDGRARAWDVAQPFGTFGGITLGQRRTVSSLAQTIWAIAAAVRRCSAASKTIYAGTS
jgi:hypothetical protein